MERNTLTPAACDVIELLVSTPRVMGRTMDSDEHPPIEESIIEKVSRIYKIPIGEIELELEERALFFRHAEEAHRETSNVHKLVAEFLQDMPEDQKRNIRLQVVRERMIEARKEGDTTELEALIRQYRVLKGLEAGITPEDIIKARSFPIGNFIKSRNGMASCIFHEDKTPSLNIKNNFYYCHSCGETGDVIDVAMKKLGITFKEAVRYLVQ